MRLGSFNALKNELLALCTAHSRNCSHDNSNCFFFNAVFYNRGSSLYWLWLSNSLCSFSSFFCLFSLSCSSAVDNVTGENLPEKINFSSSNSKLQVKTADSLLHLKGGYISFDGSQPTLTIELPEKAFDTVKIDAGAGQMKLSDLTCENLDIDFGAGSSEVINVTCKNEADFDLGVGKTVFKDCTFNDSDFDCGVGETDFSGKLLGDAEIDGGIGSINFDIDGYKNDYKIKSNSKVKINSTTEENELLYKIKLDIDNGIGEISLNFR